MKKTAKRSMNRQARLQIDIKGDRPRKLQTHRPKKRGKKDQTGTIRLPSVALFFPKLLLWWDKFLFSLMLWSLSGKIDHRSESPANKNISANTDSTAAGEAQKRRGTKLGPFAQFWSGCSLARSHVLVYPYFARS